MVWSEGKTPMTASGLSRNNRNAANAHAGAVLRASGSRRMRFAAISGSCAAMVL